MTVINSDPPINLTSNAQYLLRKRYLAKDGRRVAEAPAVMFRRVARVIAAAETTYNARADVQDWEDKFYGVMARLEFLPNSPTLLNAGRLSGQLSSCFMLPVADDSVAEIFNTLNQARLVHKSGGGTGFCFSCLAPRQASTNGDSVSGPVAFIAPYSEALEAVRQGGIRRGCSIVLLEARHPDILDFIRAKDNPQVLPNFYLSVGITGDFMRAVENDRDYELVNPHTGEPAGKLNARNVFNKMVELAWKTGDPGIVFIDRINRDNPTPQLGKIESTNPCGEQPLLPYESCNLGSINLSRMLLADNGDTAIDWEKLRDTVRLAVRFLDNVIDVNKFPLPQIAEMTRKTRKIGLGVMGFADMLIQLGIPYDSDEALKTAEEVMAFINNEAHKTSEELAQERGVFPTYKGSVYDKPNGPKMRNASCTTIAPTGTLSIIAGCSSGIEPLFKLVFLRYIMHGRRLLEVNSDFVRALRAGGFYSEGLIKRLAEGASLEDIEGISPEIKRLFVTALDISPWWQVRMQAAFQKHVDSAVSKTVNLSAAASLKDVADVYMMAYKEGLKGITIYRDQSRPNQPLGSRAAGDRLLRQYFRSQT
jgi:ribonucleoside-diphosphate reductase alpha chain